MVVGATDVTDPHSHDCGVQGLCKRWYVLFVSHLVERLVKILVQGDLRVEERRRLADLAVGEVGDDLSAVGGWTCGVSVC